MRQEIRLLSEKLKVINIILFFFFFFFFFFFSISFSLCQGYSSNKLPSCIQDIDNRYN
jgi:hypothetical protein